MVFAVSLPLSFPSPSRRSQWRASHLEFLIPLPIYPNYRPVLCRTACFVDTILLVDVFRALFTDVPDLACMLAYIVVACGGGPWQPRQMTYVLYTVHCQTISINLL